MPPLRETTGDVECLWLITFVSVDNGFSKRLEDVVSALWTEKPMQRHMRVEMILPFL